MNLKDILAISGEGTLFKFLAQGKNAVIVENLETKRRMSAGGTTRVSSLDEIAIYTTTEEMPLAKVMDKIWEKESGGETISHKSPDDQLRKYFAEIIPEYDQNRVYLSDIRKVFHWYNILHKLNLLVKEEEPKEEVKADTAETPTEEKPKKKKKTAGASVVKEEKKDDETSSVKTVKKPARKAK